MYSSAPFDGGKIFHDPSYRNLLCRNLPAIASQKVSAAKPLMNGAFDFVFLHYHSDVSSPRADLSHRPKNAAI